MIGQMTDMHLVCTPSVDPQINEYVEREILNHRILMHPHIVQFREVILLF